MEFNREKFVTVLSYIITRCENKKNVEKTVLCKLLYFSDFDYYEIYETPITNETYLKYERGPYPNHIDEIIDELIEKDLLEVKPEPYCNTTINKHYIKVDPDLSILSSDELGVINNVIDYLADMSSNEISEFSHGDMPWMIAEDNDNLDYEYVFYRDPEYSVRDYEGEISG